MNIVKEFKNCACPTYLVDVIGEDSNSRVLCCKIKGIEYSFNIEWVPEDNLEWLAGVYSSHLMEVRADGLRSFLKELKKRQKNVEDLLLAGGNDFENFIN